MNMNYDMMFKLLSSNEIYFGKIIFNDFLCLSSGHYVPTGGRYLFMTSAGRL